MSYEEDQQALEDDGVRIRGLEAELRSARRALPSAAVSREYFALRAEVAQLRADAGRLDWLIEHGFSVPWKKWQFTGSVSIDPKHSGTWRGEGTTPREAIDRAMKKHSSGGG